MRSLWLGNLVKKVLVNLLIGGKRPVELTLVRTVVFEDEGVILKDYLTKSPKLNVEWLKFGRKFTSIHMASSRYFDGKMIDSPSSFPEIDLNKLNEKNLLEIKTLIHK